MTIPRILAVALLLAIVPVTAYAAVATNSASYTGASEVSSVAKLSSLSFAVSGNATTIGNSSTPPVPPEQVSPLIVTEASTESAQTFHADASVSAKVIEQNNGTIAFNVTSVTLKIGPQPTQATTELESSTSTAS